MLIESARKQEINGYVVCVQTISFIRKLELQLSRPCKVGVSFLILVATHEDRANVIQTNTLLPRVFEVRENIERFVVV